MSYGLFRCAVCILPLFRAYFSYLLCWSFSFLVLRSRRPCAPFYPEKTLFFSTTRIYHSSSSPNSPRGSFTRSRTRPLLPGPRVKVTLQILTQQRGCHASLTSLLRILSPTCITLNPCEFVRLGLLLPLFLVPYVPLSLSLSLSLCSRSRLQPCSRHDDGGRLLCALWGGAVRK